MKTYRVQIRHPESTPMDRRYEYKYAQISNRRFAIDHIVTAVQIEYWILSHQARRLIGEVREVER